MIVQRFDEINAGTVVRDVIAPDPQIWLRLPEAWLDLTLEAAG